MAAGGGSCESLKVLTFGFPRFRSPSQSQSTLRLGGAPPSSPLYCCRHAEVALRHATLAAGVRFKVSLQEMQFLQNPYTVGKEKKHAPERAFGRGGISKWANQVEKNWKQPTTSHHSTTVKGSCSIKTAISQSVVCQLICHPILSQSSRNQQGMNQSGMSQSSLSDSNQTSINQPNTSSLGMNQMDMNQQSTSLHEMNQVDMKQPSMSQAGMRQSGTSLPHINQPGIKQPDTWQLGRSQPGRRQQDMWPQSLNQLFLSKASISQPGPSQPGPSQSGPSQSSTSQAGRNQSGVRQTVTWQLDRQQSGRSQPSMREVGTSQSGTSQIGMSQGVTWQTGLSQPVPRRRNMSSPGMWQPGMSQQVPSQPGMRQPGTSQSRKNQTGMSHPSRGHPGIWEPGPSHPGWSQQDLDQLVLSQPGLSQPGRSQPSVSQMGMRQTSMDYFQIRPAEAGDCPEILRLIKELAACESMLDAVELTAADLLRDGFGDNPLFYCLIAEVNDQQKPSGKLTVGFAMYYFTYDSWIGKVLYLEDFYVTRAYQGLGIGAEMLKRLSQIAIRTQCNRMHFLVVIWNQASVDYYTSRGALDLSSEEGWHLFRFNRGELLDMAWE
ncbi:spermidine/spermine N(1)-acetyltransferase-like protein 1 [Piliocolobus tephrosceles]|nr:spermidine/spermine N(1)-acetyltransferase-like protein 1 [Piliocolobus tephrosceles]